VHGFMMKDFVEAQSDASIQIILPYYYCKLTKQQTGRTHIKTVSPGFLMSRGEIPDLAVSDLAPENTEECRLNPNSDSFVPDYILYESLVRAISYSSRRVYNSAPFQSSRCIGSSELKKVIPDDNRGKMKMASSVCEFDNAGKHSKVPKSSVHKRRVLKDARSSGLRKQWASRTRHCSVLS